MPGRLVNPKDYYYLLLLSFLNSFANGICFLLCSSLNFIFNKNDVVREILSYLKLPFNLYLNVGFMYSISTEELGGFLK